MLSCGSPRMSGHLFASPSMSMYVGKCLRHDLAIVLTSLGTLLYLYSMSSRNCLVWAMALVLSDGIVILYLH